MSGEILEREKARQVYEEIVRKMKDPGILEYIGRNMFRVREAIKGVHVSTDKAA